MLHNTRFNNLHTSIQDICRFIGYQSTKTRIFAKWTGNIVDNGSWLGQLLPWIMHFMDRKTFCSNREWKWNCWSGWGEGKRKFNKRRLVIGQWIFRGTERSSKCIFIIPVPDRASETLFEVMRNWIKPGTTFISDCWKAYDCLNKEGFRHLRVNHKMNFVDPETSTERIFRSMELAKYIM